MLIADIEIYGESEAYPIISGVVGLGMSSMTYVGIGALMEGVASIAVNAGVIGSGVFGAADGVVSYYVDKDMIHKKL